MATGATENPEVRDLIDRGLKLSPQERESVALELLDSVESPPLDLATIQRRITDVDSGRVVALTREESELAVKAKMRELGLEL
jgi:hypothetical protein